MNKKYSISIILPVYNEEGNIEKVIEETASFLQAQKIFKDYEIIAVDDGSRDKTADILRGLTDKVSYLNVVTHCKNLGYGKALISGVKVAQHPLIFFMDADGQFNIKEMKSMLYYLEEFDIVAGYRYKRKDVFYRVILGKLYSWLVFLLFGLRLRDVNCGFKLFKRRVLVTRNINSKAGAFYTEILIRAKDKGYRIKEIPVEHFPRLNGKQTGGSLKVIFKATIDLIGLKYIRLSRRLQ